MMVKCVQPKTSRLVGEIEDIIRAQGPLPLREIQCRLWDRNCRVSRYQVLGALRSPRGIRTIAPSRRPLRSQGRKETAYCVKTPEAEI